MSNINTTNEWKISETHPGYLVRTTTRGGVTANVYKPILTPEGEADRNRAKMEKAARPLGPIMNPGAEFLR